MANNISQEEEKRIKEMIDDLVERAKKAAKEYLKLDQKTVNKVIKAMSLAGLEHHMELAKMAVEETGRGIYEDKITKNMFIIVLSMKKQLVLLTKMMKKII